ncbi:MAG: exodeoxyribonuclease VII small subunit [Desulfobulbaceae bacterium]|nr:exodeoxyribonuclease VII small subunit [Desulfobulbaceae bacterium]
MAKKTFESALRRLEQITSELEEGEPSLDKCLKKFDEGIELVKFCNSTLEEARQRVDLLIRQNGSLASVDFQKEEQKDGHQDLSD